MTDRCEPPEELRGVDGDHWLQRGGDKPEILRWQHEGLWLNVPPAYAASRPEHAAYLGYRYLCPVLTPAEADALRQEVATAKENAAMYFRVGSEEMAAMTAERDALLAENAWLRGLARFAYDEGHNDSRWRDDGIPADDWQKSEARAALEQKA